MRIGTVRLAIVVSGLPFLLTASSAMAQDARTDQMASAMSVLNVVLPREAEVALALSAAPPHLRRDATVYVYGRTGYRRVRDGSNGFSCLVNRDAFLYGAAAFKPTCWDAIGETTYLPVMLRVAELLAAGRSARAIRNVIDAGFAAGTFASPKAGGVAYMLAGDVAVDPTTGQVTRQLFPGHYMFYAVSASNAQIGYSLRTTSHAPALPVVFADGAGGSHGLGYIIVPAMVPLTPPS